jgi:protoheme IX farnesyltransferase
VLKQYYHLTKPGIIYGNLITTSAGFLLASHAHFHFVLFIQLLSSIALIIASACVVNNVIDRTIDAKMSRTQKRSLVTGDISTRAALMYATFLALAGFTIALQFLNTLTLFLGILAYFDYIVFYGITKRHSLHGTVVGSVAGALPPVAGYCAVTNHLDGGALLLFLLLVFWQMPHFYAIAMYRFKDYKAAGLPVLPVKKGMRQTKIQILIYIAAFTITGAMFTVFGYTHIVFLLLMVMLGMSWLIKGVQGFSVTDDKKWARGMFLHSLIVNLGMCLLLAVGALLY